MNPTSIRLLPAVALAALAVAPALVPAPAPPAGVASEIVFTGRVMHAASGGGVVGATVELRPGVTRAVTDRSGEYAFSVPAERLPGTKVTLSATKLGFKAVEKTVRVGGDSVRVDFALHTEAVSLEVWSSRASGRRQSDVRQSRQ